MTIVTALEGLYGGGAIYTHPLLHPGIYLDSSEPFVQPYHLY